MSKNRTSDTMMAMRVYQAEKKRWARAAKRVQQPNVTAYLRWLANEHSAKVLDRGPK